MRAILSADLRCTLTQVYLNGRVLALGSLVWVKPDGLHVRHNRQRAGSIDAMTNEPTTTPEGTDFLAAIGAESDPARRDRIRRILDDHRARRDHAAEAAMRQRLGLPPETERTAA